MGAMINTRWLVWSCLVEPHGFDLPVCKGVTFNIVLADIEGIPLTGFVKCLPILTDKLLAGAETGARRTTRSGPSTSRASPITTEGGVNDGKVVLEELPWIAGGRRVVGNGLVPGVGERGPVRDILGY